jgi:hypothetical protein
VTSRVEQLLALLADAQKVEPESYRDERLHGAWRRLVASAIVGVYADSDAQERRCKADQIFARLRAERVEAPTAPRPTVESRPCRECGAPFGAKHERTCSQHVTFSSAPPAPRREDEGPGTPPQGGDFSAAGPAPVAEKQPGDVDADGDRAGAEPADREAAAGTRARFSSAPAPNRRTSDDDVRALFADYDAAATSVYAHLRAKGIKRGSVHHIRHRAVALGVLPDAEARTVPGPPPETMGDPRTWDALVDAGVITAPAAPATTAVIPATTTPAAPTTTAPPVTVTPGPATTSYACEHCGQSFRTKARCERHEDQECPDRPRLGAQASAGASFHCGTCSYKAKHLHLLEGHVFGVHHRQLRADERQAQACELPGADLLGRRPVTWYLSERS